MTHDEIETIALFRYDLIHPLISNTFPDQNKQAYTRRIAETELPCLTANAVMSKRVL